MDTPLSLIAPCRFAPCRFALGSLAGLAVLLPVLLPLSACVSGDLRDDAPGRAQAFPPIHMQTVTPGVVFEPSAAPPASAGRSWKQIQADSARTGGPDNPPPHRRRGSSSPPPDPAVLPQPPRPVPLPPVPSTESATNAFKRDLVRPEIDRMRTDDALGRLSPLEQRDLMRRENDLRQWGDPLAR
jgi:hypothetical protein